MAIKDWQSRAAEKKAAVSAKLPKEWTLSPEWTKDVSQDSPISVIDIPRKCGLLTDRELEITEAYDATALLEKLAARKYTSLEVTTAFAKRATIAQQLTNCLTETFFDIAFERAHALDEYITTTGKPIGPLHGLPISLKDSFNVKGVHSTIGFVSFIKDEPETSNSPLVDILLSLGAVLYVKTNIPQTLMTAESHNNVFGRTLNPHKLTLTAGGSSGGEGALVAMRGSLLGIGTDIGGSIRIPALCCGVYGFKPSVGRIPYGGQTGPGRKGKEDFKACAGPLAVSQRDTELLFKAVIESDPWALDEAVIAAPFHPAPTKLRLRLGLILEDPKWPILPPVMRNLLAAVEKLKAAGHEIITLTDIPSIDQVTYLSFQYFNMDPAKTASGHIEAGGEPPIPSLAITVLKPEEYITPTLDATFGLNLERLEFKKKFRDLLLQNNLDAFICPSYQGPAAAHDTFGIPPYTVLFNLLDLPATVIPFGKAEAAKDAEFVRDVQYKPAYNAETYEGAPCSVQIVGRSFGDEKLLKDAEVIAKDLNG